MVEMDEIELLRARVAELEHRLATLSRAPRVVPRAPSVESVSTEPVGRRRLLRMAGAATVGAVAATAAGALPAAAADNGLVINMGSTSTSSELVRVDFTGADANTNTRFLFQAGQALTSNATPGSAALAGYTTQTGAQIGVAGWSTVASGVGMLGVGTGSDSVGVSGGGTGTGVIGNCDAADGRGVVGTAGLGTGVEGVGAVGVHAASGAGYGVVAEGGRAPLRFANTAAVEPPANDGMTHQAGEILLDKHGELWFCVGSGNPSTWRRLAGPATTGGLTLLPSPTRVYDSRVGYAPTSVAKGMILPGQTRTVDCRVDTGGAVPVDATGVVINLTAAETQGIGLLACHAGGTTWANTSSLNYRSGGDYANSVTVAVGAGALLNITCQGAGCHVVVDLAGFYR